MGLPGIVAAGVFAFSAAFYFSTLKPVEEEFDALRAAAERLTLRDRASTAAGKRPLGPAEQLAAFYQAFPAKQEATDGLERLFLAARAQNLTLEQGEYRLVRDRESGLLQYELTLPIKGPYPQIKAFIAQALADLPHASLDGIAFQRQKAGMLGVEARVRMTLHMREDG